MFSRKPKTVALVMQTFLMLIDDLDKIVVDQVIASNMLDIERAKISEKIEIVDTEIAQARSISKRLNVLVGGDSFE